MIVYILSPDYISHHFSVLYTDLFYFVKIRSFHIITLICAQVSTATSNEELQKLIDNEDFDFGFQCGYSKPIATIIDNKDGFINTIWMHYVCFSIHSELQQLQSGFYDTLDMRTLVHQWDTFSIEAITFVRDKWIFLWTKWLSCILIKNCWRSHYVILVWIYYGMFW